MKLNKCECAIDQDWTVVTEVKAGSRQTLVYMHRHTLRVYTPAGSTFLREKNDVIAAILKMWRQTGNQTQFTDAYLPEEQSYNFHHDTI